jgi:hypothetical protein
MEQMILVLNISSLIQSMGYLHFKIFRMPRLQDFWICMRIDTCFPPGAKVLASHNSLVLLCMTRVEPYHWPEPNAPSSIDVAGPLLPARRRRRGRCWLKLPGAQGVPGVLRLMLPSPCLNLLIISSDSESDHIAYWHPYSETGKLH